MTYEPTPASVHIAATLTDLAEHPVELPPVDELAAAICRPLMVLHDLAERTDGSAIAFAHEHGELVQLAEQIAAWRTDFLETMRDVCESLVPHDDRWAVDGFVEYLRVLANVDTVLRASRDRRRTQIVDQALRGQGGA